MGFRYKTVDLIITGWIGFSVHKPTDLCFEMWLCLHHNLFCFTYDLEELRNAYVLLERSITHQSLIPSSKWEDDSGGGGCISALLFTAIGICKRAL